MPNCRLQNGGHFVQNIHMVHDYNITIKHRNTLQNLHHILPTAHTVDTRANVIEIFVVSHETTHTTSSVLWRTSGLLDMPSDTHPALQWHHNRRDSVSNHPPHDCLLNRLLRHRSKKTSKLRATGLCVGNSPVTIEFPAQMVSNAENVSIWWRHRGKPASWTVTPDSKRDRPEARAASQYKDRLSSYGYSHYKDETVVRGQGLGFDTTAKGWTPWGTFTQTKRT